MLRRASPSISRPSSFRPLLSGGRRELFSVTAGGGKRRTGKADQGRPTDQQRAGSVFRRRRLPRCSCCFCVDLALTLGDRWPLRLHMWTTVRMLFRVAGAGRSFGAADERRRGPDDSHYRQPGIAQTPVDRTLGTPLSFLRWQIFLAPGDNSAVIPRRQRGVEEKVKEGRPFFIILHFF